MIFQDKTFWLPRFSCFTCISYNGLYLVEYTTRGGGCVGAVTDRRMGKLPAAERRFLGADWQKAYAEERIKILLCPTEKKE